MSLSKDLISQFVKATKDATTVKKESTVYGTVVKYNEKTYVKIDGSDLLTPAETLSSVEEGERVSIMIKDHTATITGNYTAPSASSIKVDGMDADLKANTANIKKLVAKNAEIENLVASKATIEDLRAANAEIDTLKSNYAEIETLVADKASIGDLEAVNADIKSLKADKADIAHLEANYATIGSLNAVYADVTRLEADKANITDLTATNAKITNLEANKADISVLQANYATIKQLDAANANITNLQTETANINNALIDKANVSDLTATNAKITDLQATKADVTELNAANANISTLTGNLAEITTLVNGNLTSDNIQSMVITGNKFTVENGFIKNAMIDSVNANKINAGVINTNNVKIQSNDGSMILQGNLQQFKDKNGKVRIQIGKDATGNFTFALYDENGTGQLINQNGIQSSNAIADGLIVDSKVADNANIAGSKLDIESVVTEINDGTTTIKGTKIYLDDKKQTLDLAFNNLSTTVENLKVASGDVGDLVEKVSTNTTNIQVAQGQINTLISNTTITKENGEVVQLKDEYNATKNTVNSHSTKIGSLETNLATANNNISSVSSKQTALEQNLNGFKQTVSQTYTTKADFNNLTLGGTNLVANSAPQSTSGWSPSTGWVVSLVDCATAPYGKAIRVTNNSGTSGSVHKPPIDHTKCVNGEYYTISAWIRASKSCKIDFHNEMMVNTNNINLTTSWKYYTFTSKINTGATYHSDVFYVSRDTIKTGMWLEIHSLKFEKGTKPSSWSPAPQDIDASITAVDNKFTNYSTTSQMNSAINQKANEITSTVSQTYATKAALNTVDGKFADYSTTSAMNSAINQKANEITSSVSQTYATKTSVTDVANNLKNNYSTTSAMNSAINQKANEITSSVSQTYATKTALKATDDKFANYSTTSQMNTAINQKSDAILSTVSATYTTKADFNSLDIGGRNFLVGTKNAFTKALNTSNSANDFLTNDPYTTYSSKTLSSLGLKVGDKITVSFDWSLSNVITAGNFRVETVQDSTYKSLVSGPHNFGSATSGRYVGTKTLTSSDVGINKIRIRVDASNLTMTIKNMKLEKGNKDTSWSPAPEDIDTAISTVDGKFTNYSTTSQMNSAINQKANEITSSVSQTYATKTSLKATDDKFANYSTTSQMNTAINQKADSITQSVSNTYATKTSLNAANNNITSLTNRMSNAESKLTKDSLTTTIGSYYTTSNDVNGLITSKGYATTSQVTQTATDLTAKFTKSGGYNLIQNSSGLLGAYSLWTVSGLSNFYTVNTGDVPKQMSSSSCWKAGNTVTSEKYAYSYRFKIKQNTTYTLSGKVCVDANTTGIDVFVLLSDSITNTGNSSVTGYSTAKLAYTTDTNKWWKYFTYTFTTGANDLTCVIRIDNNGAKTSGKEGFVWFGDLQLEEGSVAHPWSPHPSECYTGITKISADGIKVFHNNIDGENYTHMASSGFYIKNKGTDIFKVDSNGLYVKGNGEFTGKITSTSGAIGGFNISEYNIKGTNVGMGCSSGHDYAFWAGASTGDSAPFKVGHNGNLVATQATITGNVTIKGGSVPSTILTGTIDNARLNSSIVNGAANGSSAKSTLDSKANGWDSAKSTVDNNKTNWSNAYNRVVQWASGSVTGNTTINGGLIQTGTVTAKQLYLGDLTNYCNLREETASLYGFTSESSSWGTWYKLNNNQRDICISGNKANDYYYYKCMGGESFRIKFEVKSNVKGSSTNGGSDSVYCGVNIGLYGKLGDGNNFYQIPSSGYVGDANSTEGHINVWTTLPANARSFGVFLQLSGWGNWSGTCRIKNVQVFRMSSGELIVDGSVTADKIAANAITGKTITGGTINGSVINGTTINSDSFIGDMLAIDGTISAKSLQVQDIDNAKYPGAVTADFRLYVSTSGNDDSEIENGATFATFDALLDKLPKNLNGHEVRIEMSTNITENVDFKGFFGGKIRLYMKGHTLYGYVVSRMGSARINICSGYIGNATDESNGWGKIHPSKGYAVSSYTTTVASVDQGAIGLYNIDVYGADNYLSGSTTKLGVAGQDWGTAYLNGVSYYGCDMGARANAGGRIHDVLSYNVCKKYGFYATTGGYITLAGSEHSGGKSKNYHEADAGKVIVASGATFAGGEASVPGGSAPVVPTTKTITIKSTYGDTYRSSVYNNWKKDGTVRQGDYGYGDCNGCWFFGDAFSDVEGKTITKVTIKITRQSGGSSSAVGLVVKSHGYSGRPSGKPSYRTTAGTLSLATGQSDTLPITNSTILNEIKSGAVKGFGIQTTYDSSHYAVCSGSVTVKITYKE